MGLIISKFRSKTSTSEELEKLEKEITKLKKFRIQNQERQKRFIAKLLLYSILVYIVGALVFYFYYFPDRWKERLLYSIPLLLFPFIIWGVKKSLHWYFIKRIAKNDLALEDLRDKKKQMLEDVMEKETYKKAKEILEKFDPERFKEMEAPKPTPMKSPGSELRQRQVGVVGTPAPGSQVRPAFMPRGTSSTPMRLQGPGVPMRPGMTPYGPRGSSQAMQPRNLMVNPQSNGHGSTPQGPVLPRPILPRERGTMDRLLEYLVGDGPQNRYALICRNCCSHNGMALKEEFEYIAFKCCYCQLFNPARKKRPFAPRIEPPPVVRQETSSQDEDPSGSEEGSEEEEGEEGARGGGIEELNNEENQVREDGERDRDVPEGQSQTQVQGQGEGHSGGENEGQGQEEAMEVETIEANEARAPSADIDTVKRDSQPTDNETEQKD